MHKVLRFVVLFVALAAAALPRHPAGAQDNPGTVVALRAFLNAVAAKDYATAWSGFSAKTKALVVQSITEGQKELTADEIRKLLDTNDQRTQAGFWEHFRTSANSAALARLPMRAATAAGADGAVKVTAPSKAVATFLMYKEAGAWKVGWMETFFGGELPPKK
jgi:hypothetical protein